MGIVAMPRDLIVELARLNDANIFIETGTYHGGTARWASGVFETVHTIERSKHFFEMHKQTLAQVDGVTVHFGDSRDLLPPILHQIGGKRAVFWLDGHWSGGMTAGENDDCPLMTELDCLSSRNDDIILIDDARMFLCTPPLPHKPHHWPNISEVISTLTSKTNVPFIQIIDDIIFAVPRHDELQKALTEYAQMRSANFWREFARFSESRSESGQQG